RGTQVRLVTGWFLNAELRASVSYMPGTNTGFGSSSGTLWAAACAMKAPKARQANKKGKGRTGGVLVDCHSSTAGAFRFNLTLFSRRGLPKGTLLPRICVNRVSS